VSYKLETHYWLQISLKHWLWMIVIGPPALALLRRLSWPVAALVSVIGAVLLAGTEWARRRLYALFQEGTAAREADTPPVQMDEQIRCRAFGRFAVGGKERYVANEDALFSFVSTREHIAMAYVRRTRFLLLATSLKKDVGWWYVFVTPDRLREVRPGILWYGLYARAALQVAYRSEQKPDQVETLHLVFDDAETRQRVTDDLALDMPARPVD
jgi:hypothetical protein